MTQKSLIVIFLAFAAFSCFTKSGEVVADEVLRKPVKDGVVVVQQKSVEPELPTKEKQAELNRVSPGAVYSIPNSAVELSVVKITSLGESLLWKRTANQYPSGTRFQMLDVLVEGDSYVVLYQYITPSISFVYAELITPQQPFSQVRPKNARFPMPVYSRGPFVQSALLKGSFAQNDLSAEVNLGGDSLPLLFVYDGKQWGEQKTPPPAESAPPARPILVDPDAAYRGRIQLQKYPQPGDTLTVTRRLLRPMSDRAAPELTTTQSSSAPRSYMYQFQLDSSRPPLAHRPQTLWSQRLDNVTNDAQLWRIWEADYNAKTQILVYIYAQGKSLFANVVRPNSPLGQGSLPLSVMRLPDVDASLIERAVVENGSDRKSLEFTLILQTQKKLRFRLEAGQWVPSANE